MPRRFKKPSLDVVAGIFLLLAIKWRRFKNVAFVNSKLMNKTSFVVVVEPSHSSP